MKLKDYVENLNEFIDQNPEALEMETVYSSDDEGNSFHNSVYPPTMGYYNNEDREFSTNLEDVETEYFEDVVEANAVCIN